MPVQSTSPVLTGQGANPMAPKGTRGGDRCGERLSGVWTRQSPGQAASLTREPLSPLVHALQALQQAVHLRLDLAQLPLDGVQLLGSHCGREELSGSHPTPYNNEVSTEQEAWAQALLQRPEVHAARLPGSLPPAGPSPSIPAAPSRSRFVRVPVELLLLLRAPGWGLGLLLPPAPA